MASKPEFVCYGQFGRGGCPKGKRFPATRSGWVDAADHAIRTMHEVVASGPVDL